MSVTFPLVWSCFICSQIRTFPAVFYYNNQVQSNQINQLYRKCKDWQVKVRQPEHKRWGFYTTLHKQPFSPISDLANLAMIRLPHDGLGGDWGAGDERGWWSQSRSLVPFLFRESQMGVSFILATLCRQPNQNLIASETPCRILHFSIESQWVTKKSKPFLTQVDKQIWYLFGPRCRGNAVASSVSQTLTWSLSFRPISSVRTEEIEQLSAV